MKMKNLVLGLMVAGSLTMVGCDDVKDTSDALDNQPTKKVEEKVENKEVETEKETETKEVKEEKAEPKKEEKGQCYDCGEYFPVKDMSFNGRSYHCGCVACEACGTRMHSKKEMKTSLYTGGTICKDCYVMEQNEKQYESEEETTEPEVMVPMCERCGERPADYVESGLCNQCVESTGYEYGDEVEY